MSDKATGAGETSRSHAEDEGWRRRKHEMSRLARLGGVGRSSFAARGTYRYAVRA